MRAVGILLILLSLPAFIVWLRSDKRNYRYAYIAIGSFPFVMSALNVDASFWNVSGLTYARGVILTLLDTLCLAILANKRHRILHLPFTGLWVAYIFAVLISILPAEGVMAPFSYAFQLMRAFLVFATVATIVQEKDTVRYIAYGLAFGAMMQGLVTIVQRLGGDFQAAGTMGHQNLTGMVLHFSTLPLLAMLLAGDRSKIYMGGVAGGLIAVALGASRGSIAFLGVGLMLLLMLSIVRHSTPRKFSVAGLSALMILAASPIVWSSIQERLSNVEQRQSADEERAAFKRAASMMFADHPLGVGANRYSLVANIGGYSERAGVHWGHGSRSAMVHNLYYLTAAELGWLGLLVLIPFLLWIIIRGLRFTFKYRRDARGDIVLGCTCAVIAVALQSNFEWVFVMVQTQYVFAISVGIMAGFIVQRRSDFARMRREARRSGEVQRRQDAVVARTSG